MTKPLAIRCCYADWKLVRTRQVIQLVFEVPLAEADAAYEVIGGMPDPSKERWFAIAALRDAKEVMPHPEHQSISGHDNAQPPSVVELRSVGAKRDWHNVQPAAQAGIRCNEPTFVAFLQENFTDDWGKTFLANGAIALHQRAAECVRTICGVKSRVEFSTDRRARVMWHQLDQQFLAWKNVERQS